MSSDGAQQRIVRERLEGFLDAHPDGWYDGDWRGFVDELQSAGVELDNVDEIGLELERGRLLRTLAACDVRGLGPKRRAAIATRYGTIWNLRQASPDDVANVPGMNRQIADEVKAALD